MASIGDLVANLSVNAAPFSKGLSSATSSIGSFSKSATASMGAMGSSAAVFMSVGKLAAVGFVAASAIAAAAIYTVSSSITKLADVADKAAQTGISGKFLMQLGYAADQSGVSSETLTKSVAKMTLTIGDAKNGSDSAAKALDGIGLSVEDLEGLDPQAQFMKVADSLGSIPDVAQRAAASVDIFGKAGAELGPMFAGGSAALGDLLSQADGLGIGISDEDLAKAAAADDAIQRMKASIGAIVSSASAKLAPAFTMVADTITAITPVFSALVETVISGFSTIGPTAASVMEFIVSTIVTGMSVAEFSFNNFGKIVSYVMLNAHIAVLALFDGIGHFFDTVLPTYLTWFGENWSDVFFTAGDIVMTMFINLGENIRNAWSSIMAFISGESDGLEFVWKPLTDGFVNTVKALPDIPERAIGQLETQLRADSARIGGELGNGLTDTIAKNMAMIPKMNAILKLTEGERAPGTGEDPTGRKKTGEMKFSGALQMGSSEAYSAIVAAMGASGDTKQLMDANKTLKEINKSIRDKGMARGESAILVESIA